jgi:hypothetical protein
MSDTTKRSFNSQVALQRRNYRLLCRALAFIVVASSLNFLTTTTNAASFTTQVFATGAAVGGTSPDSVEFGDGSLWVSYQNGADSTGTSGSSTVVRYSPSGAILKTWSIAGER